MRAENDTTYRTIVKNNVHTSTLRVSHFLPKKPRRSWFHSFHFCCRSNVFSSARPRLVIERSSSLLHSGPKRGTVTSSTGSVSWPPFTDAGGVFRVRYLTQYGDIRSTIHIQSSSLATHPAFPDGAGVSRICAPEYRGPALLKSAYISNASPLSSSQGEPPFTGSCLGCP